MTTEGRLPDWETVRALLLRPRPPLRATVYALGKPVTGVRLGADDEGPAWAASWVDPSRFAGVHTADGEVVGEEPIGGRPTLVAEVRGLRGKGTSRVWVDRDTGAIVRVERMDDPAPLVVVELEEPGD